MQVDKRSRYFLSHLVGSVIVACILLAVIFLIWYPTPLAQAVGINHIIFMLIIIDITIGPVLSFLIYKEGKKSLVFDLSVILILQISALFYGVYNIAQGRPAWIVYYKNSYELIRHADVIIESNLKKSSPWFGPKYVGIKLSSDPKKFSQELSLELSGFSLAQYPERYIPIENVKDDMKKYALPVQKLSKYNDPSMVSHILSHNPKAQYFFPMKASFEDITVLVDDTYQVIKIVNLRPWE